MLSELINLNLFAFLLVFARVGTAISLLPGFGSQQIPMDMRIVFALAVTLVLTPGLTNLLPAEPKEVSVLFLLLVSEITIGAFLGLLPRVFLSALQTAGTVLSMVASLSNMFIQDPIAEQQSSILASYLGVVALTLIFVTDTHHLMLTGLVDSYAVFNPVDGPPISDMTDHLARQVAESFLIGVQITSPLIVSGVAYYLMLGIMGRLMPQLQVFFFGMPIQIGMQLYLIMVTLTAMLLVFMNYMEDGLAGVTQPLAR